MLHSPLFLKTGTIPVWRALGWVFRLVFTCLMIRSLANSCWAQESTPNERNKAQAMLHDLANDVKWNYYDPNLHGALIGTQRFVKQKRRLTRRIRSTGLFPTSLHSLTVSMTPTRTSWFRHGPMCTITAFRCK